LSAGIKAIRDLLDNAFVDKYSIKTNYLEYYKAISAVAHYKKVHSRAYHDQTPNDSIDTLLSHTVTGYATVLTSPNNGETAVRCCEPPLLVLVIDMLLLKTFFT